MIFVRIIYLLLVILISLSNAKPSDYLYSDGKSAPIIDLRKELREGAKVIPEILSSKRSVNRIIKFYAPWCGHCQDYKPEYIQTARLFEKQYGGSSVTNVEFHAVSCEVHPQLCRHFKVQGYPTLYAMKANSDKVYHFKDDFNSHDVAIFFSIGKTKKTGLNNLKKKNNNLLRSVDLSEKLKTYKIKDIESTYDDAGKSLVYALEHGVHLDKANLKGDRFEALYEWFSVLDRVLPSHWGFRKLANKMHEDIRYIAEGQTQLMDVLSNDSYYKEIEKKPWSMSCTHNDEVFGYACGLWEALHIVTLGVEERRNELFSLEKDEHNVSSEYVGEVLRNFIQNFFGCEECRTHFVQIYDDCLFDRCTRLDNTVESSRELALWLWEAHNHINVRLWKEKNNIINRSLTQKERISALWPSRMDCPACWMEGRDDNVDEMPIYNNGAVYEYLKKSYWKPSSSILPENIMSSFLEAPTGLSSSNLEFEDVAVLSRAAGVYLSVITLWVLFRMCRQRKKKIHGVESLKHQ